MFLCFLLFWCCKKCCSNRKMIVIDKRKVEESMLMKLKAPCTFTPSLTELTVRSNSLSHQVISVIKRSHSIHEYTQTDIDEKDIGNSNRKEESPSQEQIQQLNVLLDTMEDYNCKLQDECTAESLRPGRKGKNRTYNDCKLEVIME